MRRSAGAREPFLRLADTSAVRRYLRVPRTPDRRLSFRTEGTIQLEVGLGGGRGREPFEDEGPRSRADLPLQPRVARQRVDLSGHRRGAPARNPVRPCSMISRWASMSETTDGRPAAIASMTALGEPSQ